MAPPRKMQTAEPLLGVYNLSKTYTTKPGMFASRQTLRAVDDVSFEVHRGETLGLVGESGCGKSTLGRCITRLYTPSAGRIELEGHDVAGAKASELLSFRQRVQMIFQDPSASLNPRRRIRDLLGEPIRVHKIRAPDDIAPRLQELMRLVGLPEGALDRYPHEFSGGQRQRVGIARALAMEPEVIIADEPVSALDVSVQAQIINLLTDLREKIGLTYIFVAHDLAVIRQISTRVAVMYLGSVVEIGDTDTVFDRPAHPYTQALISAIPGTKGPRTGGRILLHGEPPSPFDHPTGCKFSTRCPLAQPKCRVDRPTLTSPGGGTRNVACHFPLTAD